MKDVFILLSGPSLNDITEQEKEYIRSCPVIAVGLYMHFWELIGIKPSIFLQVQPAWNQPFGSFIKDSHGKSATLKSIGEIIEYHNMDCTIYANPENARYLKGGDPPCPTEDPYYAQTLRDLEDVKLFSKNCLARCDKPFNFEIKSIDVDETSRHRLIQKYSNTGPDPVWAKTLEDRFLGTSSVSSAINLATVLYPGANVKLLGNDGGPQKYFYNSIKDDQILSLYDQMLRPLALALRSSNPHYNSSNGNYPVDYIMKKVKESGCSLYNCSLTSIFSSAFDKSGADFKKFDKGTRRHIGKIPYCKIIPLEG